MNPVRLQRSRRKGARLVSPNGLPIVYVGRATRFGNPYRVGQYIAFTKIESVEQAVEYFRRSIERWPAHEFDELRGKNLACWCPLDQPCHADVLLEIANMPAREVAERGQ